MATEMAYVDPVLHMPDDYGHDDYGGYGQGSLVIHNKMPLKEILLAVTLLALGTFGIVLGFFFIFTQTGADQARGKNVINSLILDSPLSQHRSQHRNHAECAK